MDYGGAMTNQYDIPWDWDNAGGYMTKITVTPLEGEPKVLGRGSGIRVRAPLSQLVAPGGRLRESLDPRAKKITIASLQRHGSNQVTWTRSERYREDYW